MYNILSEKFNAFYSAIETGLILPTKPYSEDEPPTYDVTKFEKFWSQYSKEREHVRKREVDQMLEDKKELYINVMLGMGEVIFALLIIIVYICCPE